MYFMEFGNPLQDSCDLTGFSVGMNAPAHGGGSHRRAQIHDITGFKASDYLTGVLLQYCGAGKKIDAVALKVYAEEDSDKPYLTYLLKDVFIVSVYAGRDGQDDVFQLNAKTITVNEPAGL